jgi:hypothetical protein
MDFYEVINVGARLRPILSCSLTSSEKHVMLAISSWRSDPTMDLFFCSSKVRLFFNLLPSSSPRKGNGLCRTISSGNVTSKTLSLSNTRAECQRTPRDPPWKKKGPRASGQPCTRRDGPCKNAAAALHTTRASRTGPSFQHAGRPDRARSPRHTQNSYSLQVSFPLQLLRSLTMVFSCGFRKVDVEVKLYQLCLSLLPTLTNFLPFSLSLSNSCSHGYQLSKRPASS